MPSAVRGVAAVCAFAVTPKPGGRTLRSRVLAKMAPLSQSASTIAAPPDPIATLAHPDHPASPSPRFSYRNVASTAGAGSPHGMSDTPPRLPAGSMRIDNADGQRKNDPAHIAVQIHPADHRAD